MMAAMTVPANERPPHARRFDSLEQEAFLNLWRTYDRLHLAEEELFNRYDLTPQQYNALRLLRSQHPDKLATLVLAERLVSRAPDITRLVDKLATRNLVERQRPLDNRRMVLVGITGEGIKLLGDLGQEVRACHQRQLGHLSATQLHQLIELLYAARRPHEEAGSSWL
jgi:DNA-binding MarR family transcriptional regulator